ncbi:MAG: bifunctional pyr operon transcriptional regulator/uracil phosphoribosyltransferase PyrR [bacterium]
MSKTDKKVIAEIMDARGLDRTLARLAHEIIERNRGAENLVIVGLRTRGAPLAERLNAKIEEVEGSKVPQGVLDVTLYRDDFSKRSEALAMQTTDIPFDLDGKVVLIVDDVLYTGRTIRAAMDALVDFGRPARIELAVMVDRGHRELPIKADYIGKSLLTSLGEEVAVRLENIDGVDGVDLVVSNREG